MTESDEFAPVKPWPLPRKEDCVFYHSMTYPEGDSIDGAWDIRGLFDQYIGDYPIRGKTVLDVGTAGGFLAIEAEKSGATVTALDAFSAGEFERIPFRDSLYHLDRKAFVEQTDVWLKMLRNGFWYSWNRCNSGLEMVYAPLARLPYWHRKFDVVIAGAILEHLSDPVAAIANMAGVANEAVVIAFTPVIADRRQFMETANDWSKPEHNFTFWTLSLGLYKRVFRNMGFDVEFRPAKARFGGGEHYRETIIARRVR
jgi:ubiquinone/menaquinone biosynthesis C-methylase UbiE